MAAISETTFSNAFCWMKMFEFLLKFHLSSEVCSLGSNWQYPNIDSDDGLEPTRWQAIIWTSDGSFTDAYTCVTRP